MFGGEYYIDPCRSEVSITNNALATDEWKNQHLGVGDVVYRDYDSFILQNGIFAQAEYNKNNINTFISGSINLTDFGSMTDSIIQAPMQDLPLRASGVETSKLVSIIILMPTTMYSSI